VSDEARGDVTGDGSLTLTWGEIGDLLAGVGNHEGKAALILAMQLGQGYGAADLHGLHLQMQGPDPVFRGGQGNQGRYCQLSFEPIGAVTLTQPADTVEYQLVGGVGQAAQGVAGLALVLSEAHPGFTLRRIFGVTKSASQDARSPLRRVEIMAQLVAARRPDRHTPPTLDAIQRRLPHRNPTTVGMHLAGMHRAGLLQVQSRAAPDQHLEYALTGRHGPVARHPAHVLLAGQVLDSVRTLAAAGGGGWVTLTDLDAHVRPRYLHQQHRSAGAERDQSARAEVVRRAADHLVLQGFLDKRGHRFSAVTATDTQTALIREVLALVGDLQTRASESLARGRELGRQIVADPERINPLLAKCYGTSPEVNRTSSEEKAALVVRYLADHPDATTTQIAAALATRNLSKAQIAATLRSLRDRDRLAQGSRGHRSTWRLHDPHQHRPATGDGPSGGADPLAARSGTPTYRRGGRPAARQTGRQT
jgi:hypothetical protein